MCRESLDNGKELDLPVLKRFAYRWRDEAARWFISKKRTVETSVWNWGWYQSPGRRGALWRIPEHPAGRLGIFPKDVLEYIQMLCYMLMAWVLCGRFSLDGHCKLSRTKSLTNFLQTYIFVSKFCCAFYFSFTTWSPGNKNMYRILHTHGLFDVDSMTGSGP